MAERQGRPVVVCWLLGETPWPEQAALVYGEMVELTTPPPPIPKLGWLGPETVGSRSVVVACVEQDERDGHVGPLYAVETEDGSPWRLRSEFLVSPSGEEAGAMRGALGRSGRSPQCAG